MRRSGLAGTIILGSRRLDETRGIGAVPVRRLSPKPVLIRCGDRHVAAHSLHESVMLYALSVAYEHGAGRCQRSEGCASQGRPRLEVRKIPSTARYQTLFITSMT